MAKILDAIHADLVVSKETGKPATIHCQKIISAMTTRNQCFRAVPRPVSTAGLRHGGPATTSRASGEVPDAFSSSPAEIVALFAWDGRLIDVTDVIDTQRKDTPTVTAGEAGDDELAPMRSQATAV